MSDLIFDTEPANWQELEDLVCQAFQEMGYESRRNEAVKTVRGKVNIDVCQRRRENVSAGRSKIASRAEPNAPRDGFAARQTE
jgi:hypothetical protein